MILAEFKYVVANGNEILGIMWKVNDNREIFVTNGDKLNINHSLAIRDSSGNLINEVEVLELLSEILPR